MIKVYVPATSANLGPGYDCLGIALDEIAEVSFEILDQGLQITGCEEQYCNKENLIYTAFCEALSYLGESIPGLHIDVVTNIPYTRGLGSSAACIVAGVAGANALFQNRMNKYEMFSLCTKLEGHPDNIAPAIFGALCVSFMEEDKPNMIKFGIKKNMIFCTMIPDYEVNTKEARMVLPTTMSYQDAIYQMGRCCAFAKAMEIGNPMILKKACTDKMQEPYRKTLIPEYDHIQELCDEHGAITMFISGSGSTMIALSNDEDIADTLLSTVQKEYPTWSCRKLYATYDGVRSEEV